MYFGGKKDASDMNILRCIQCGIDQQQSFGIFRTHLMKVAMALVAEKLLLSERGRNGGIRPTMANKLQLIRRDYLRFTSVISP